VGISANDNAFLMAVARGIDEGDVTRGKVDRGREEGGVIMTGGAGAGVSSTGLGAGGGGENTGCVTTSSSRGRPKLNGGTSSVESSSS
jgi:hypothetical protein